MRQSGREGFLTIQPRDGDNATYYCFPPCNIASIPLSQVVICLQPTKVGVCNRIDGGVNTRGETLQVSAVHKLASSIDCVYSSFSLQTIMDDQGTHPGLTAGWERLKAYIFTISLLFLLPPHSNLCQHNGDKSWKKIKISCVTVD